MSISRRQRISPKAVIPLGRENHFPVGIPANAFTFPKRPSEEQKGNESSYAFPKRPSEEQKGNESSLCVPEKCFGSPKRERIEPMRSRKGLRCTPLSRRLAFFLIDLNRINYDQVTAYRRKSDFIEFHWITGIFVVVHLVMSDVLMCTDEI